MTLQILQIRNDCIYFSASTKWFLCTGVLSGAGMTQFHRPSLKLASRRFHQQEVSGFFHGFMDYCWKSSSHYLNKWTLLCNCKEWQHSQVTSLHLTPALPSPRALFTTSAHHEEAKRKKAGGKLKPLPQADMQKGALHMRSCKGWETYRFSNQFEFLFQKILKLEIENFHPEQKKQSFKSL